MSTVQESPIDSPTVPIRYSVLPRVSQDTAHNRSSSAPGECIRDSQTLPAQSLQPLEPRLKPTWASKQAQTHPLAIDNGLGLSLPESNLSQRQPRRQGPSKPKPNLTIKTNGEDKPPPPPPKSPRHSRDPSAHSLKSNVRGESPDSSTLATPGSIMRAALVQTRGSPVRTPITLNAKQESYFPPTGPLRVREVALGENRPQPTERPSLQPTTQKPEEPHPVKSPAPNVDKPMPSLPIPSSRFSDHIRQVREAEKSQGKKTTKAPPLPTGAKSLVALDAGASNPSTRSALADRKNDESSSIPDTESLNSAKSASPQDPQAPAPDLHGRPSSPANLLQVTSSSAKVLPVLPTEAGPRSRSATPESSVRTPKLSEPKSGPSDPLQTLQELSKQCEALHARYASLRAERLKLSTSISASLKDEKPGPDYANSLLDQHLALNAINSSMDICFAKLKSLDCRKEEAMATFMRQTRAKSIMDDTRKSSSLKAYLLSPLAIDSGRTTPEMSKESKSPTPELATSAKFPPISAPAESNSGAKPEVPTDAIASPNQDNQERKDKSESEKRITVVRASPSRETVADTDDNSPPVSPISSLEDKPKRIRIKGVKAAKILGLVAQSANGTQGNKGITLPDESPAKKASLGKPVAVEVEIKPRSSFRKKKRNTASTIAPAMPDRKPPPPPRQGTNDSVSSIATSSNTESSPEQPEIKTPRGSQDEPLGLKSAKRGMLQTIQVFVDDDILDYYHGG